VPRLLGTGLTREIEFLAARARAIGTATANQHLAPLDLRVRAYSVLALACSGENPSQRELAAFLSLDASQIVALVDDLEQRGLVARIVGAQDRRSKSITATDEGQRLFTKARSAVQKAEDESLAGLDAHEKETLRVLLTRIAFPA
jgi:DNA-binding MarR family transcriptional regulator